METTNRLIGCRFDRDWLIWGLHNAGSINPEIAEKAGCSVDAVRYALSRLEFVEALGTMESYGAMAFDILELILECGGDPDKCLTNIMTALWIDGINTKSKLKAMSASRFEEFLVGKRMRRAGKVAQTALRKYRDTLRGKKV